MTVSCGDTIFGNATGLTTRDSKCGFTGNAPLWYAVSVPKDYVLRVSTCNAATTQDTVVVLTDSCSNGTCLAANDNAYNYYVCGRASIIRYVSAATATYYFGVFAASTGALFEATVTCTAPPPVTIVVPPVNTGNW